MNPLEAISVGIAEADAGTVAHVPLWQFRDEWPVDGLIICEVRRPLEYQDRPLEYQEQPSRPRPRPPPWFVGMSKEFRKGLDNIDRKLKGRILDAVAELAANPIEAHGDTKKPLTGDLAGCWRYRIGEYRLVYRPDKKDGNVTLLFFGPRGGVYE